jgi:hypothetical protein
LSDNIICINFDKYNKQILDILENYKQRTKTTKIPVIDFIREKLLDNNTNVYRFLLLFNNKIKEIFKNTSVPNIILEGGKRSRKLNNFILIPKNHKNVKKSNVHKKRKQSKKILSINNNKYKKTHTAMMM